MVEKPRGSNPTSPSMLPSRVAGEVAKGRAVEGPAAAQAAADADPPDALGAAFTDLVPFLRTLVAMRGAVYAEAEATRARRARESFILS